LENILAEWTKNLEIFGLGGWVSRGNGRIKISEI
jgi:CRISPR/Cas system CSM-associated protein Csm3 (group 7 of RAMP superfamily)